MPLLPLWSSRPAAEIIQAAATVSAAGSTPAAPLQSSIPSYPYLQYSDDPNIVAFFSAYNQLAQSYLDWFNQTPLSVYTDPNVNGQLLDWIALGIYGLERPVFSSILTSFRAGINAFPINVSAIDGSRFRETGKVTQASDDYFRRYMTWWLYLGQSRYFTVPLLRAKVARFLYGVNGTDITQDQAQTVHISAGPLAPPPVPSLSYVAGGAIVPRTYGVRLTYVTPMGETIGGPGKNESVPGDALLKVASPPPATGATAYNVYMKVINAGKFLAGINALPLNATPINGSNALPVEFPTLQNMEPIPIGTSWTEPNSGWVYGPGLPGTNTSNPATNFIITVPNTQSAKYFKQAFEQGILAFPFMLTASVIIE